MPEPDDIPEIALLAIHDSDEVKRTTASLTAVRVG
jgi:hypothetical protein